MESPDLSPSDLSATAAPTLSSLPAELLGRTSTFLPLTVAESDVLSFLLALKASPSLSRTVKHWYLKGNASYIEDYLYQFVSEYLKNQKRRKKGEKAVGILSTGLQSWMEINVGWRDACRPYSSTVRELSGLFITDNSVKSHEIFLEFATTSWRSNHLTLMDRRLFVHRYRSPDETPDVEHDVFHEKFVPERVVAGIDGIDALGLPFSQVKEMIRGAQNVKLLCKAAEFFFTNAAFAIELGLFDLFRFIIEDIGTDLSYNKHGGLRLVDLPLVGHALVQADPRYFDYLLSLDAIDPNPTLPPIISNWTHRSSTLLHITMGEHSPFLDFTFEAEDAPEDIRRAKAIIQSEKVDVNTRNSYGFTPLDYLIYNPRAHIHASWDPRIVHKRTIYSYDMVDIYLTKAILDRGGIITTGDLSTNLSWLPNRRGHRGIIAKLLEADDAGAREAIISDFESRKRKR